MDQPFDYCIVGAGPSGLTAAYKLLQAGKRVVVVERDDRAGGLAKSYDYDGQVFDTGPKRFHTDDPIVTDFIHHVLGDDIRSIGRSTKVYFLGRYFEWPLQSKDLIKLPFGTSFRCALDLLRKPAVTDGGSFHDFVRSKYGETLYQVFFAPYTHKFLRWDVEDIHSDWASTGINRTVIDKRIRANSLFDLLKSLALPSKVDTEFLYPAHGGFGAFYDVLLERCRALPGFELVLDDQITALEDRGTAFDAQTRAGRSLSFDQLIWTGNLNDLGRLTGAPDDRRMHYLNTVFFNLVCKEEGIRQHRAQWIYVSKGDTLISRITCMREFAPTTCLDGYYNLICELTDSQTNPVYFNEPQRYRDDIVAELVTMGFLKDARFVEAIRVEPVRDTYPIYHRRYMQDFAAAAGGVKKFSKRIHLLGRCGAFWYNNSDHSIRFALETAERLLKKDEREFDYRHYFGGVYGRAAAASGE